MTGPYIVRGVWLAASRCPRTKNLIRPGRLPPAPPRNPRNDSEGRVAMVPVDRCVAVWAVNAFGRCARHVGNLLVASHFLFLRLGQSGRVRMGFSGPPANNLCGGIVGLADSVSGAPELRRKGCRLDLVGGGGMGRRLMQIAFYCDEHEVCDRSAGRTRLRPGSTVSNTKNKRNFQPNRCPCKTH